MQAGPASLFSIALDQAKPARKGLNFFNTIIMRRNLLVVKNSIETVISFIQNDIITLIFAYCKKTIAERINFIHAKDDNIEFTV